MSLQGSWGTFPVSWPVRARVMSPIARNGGEFRHQTHSVVGGTVAPLDSGDHAAVLRPEYPGGECVLGSLPVHLAQKHQVCPGGPSHRHCPVPAHVGFRHPLIAVIRGSRAKPPVFRISTARIMDRVSASPASIPGAGAKGGMAGRMLPVP